MKTTHLEAKKHALMSRREQLLGQFNEAARANKETARCWTEIRRANEFLASLDQIVEENRPDPAAPRRYAVSSMFLYESYKKLTADRDEQFFFVTGIEVEGVQVLDQWAELAHHRRSPLGVVADIPSTHNLLIKLEQFGHRFLAHFHSHPGNGPNATHPSGIDLDFQKRLERAGHRALMAIFSRDGFVRIVRLDHNYELDIYGKGVEQHAADIYRLTETS